MRKVIAIAACFPILFVSTGQHALGADTSRQISVPDDTGGRVDSRMDLIEFRAIEPTPWVNDNWEFELMLVRSCGYHGPTDEGRCIYGVDLDYDGDQVADMVLSSNYAFDPFKGGSENALLIDVSTKEILCEGKVSASYYVSKDHWWGGTLAPFVKLSIGKSCLTQSANVGLSAWATLRDTGVFDLIPDSGFQSFRQPWVESTTEQDSVEYELAKKITLGSFKGFIAIYTRGYEGSKLSAKVAGKWLTVDSLDESWDGNDYSRTVRFTGAGYSIFVHLYIDGEYIRTDELTTE